MIKKIIEHLGGRGYTALLTAIVAVGTFLRFYKLGEFITFLSDQGRDAIIMRRLITFEHFPAIGPVTSIGGIFLGPFYYYFIAPWILLFKFDPVGLAFGVAFLSSIFLIVQYLIVKDMFDKKAALISVALVALGWTMIEFSRFSWNPNLLPHFALLTVWASYKAFQTRKLKYYALVGVTLAIDIQLHYLALFALPAAALLLLADFIRAPRKMKMQIVKGKVVAVGFFALLCAPLVVFDLKHQFLNSKNFLALTGHSNTVNHNLPVELLNAFTFLNGYFFKTSFYSAFYVILLLCLLAILISSIMRRNYPLTILFVYFFSLLSGVALYSGPKYVHYFASLYIIYAVIIGFGISLLTQGKYAKIGWVISCTLVVLFFMINSPLYVFMYGQGPREVDQAKRVASVIYSHIDRTKYTVTALPNQYSDSPYRYFLELWNKRPLEKDSLEKADELFAVCEGECQPIGNPQWDIAFFAPTKLVDSYNADSFIIKKLTR